MTRNYLTEYRWVMEPTETREPSPRITDPYAAGRFFLARLQSFPVEHFEVATLDTRNRIIAVTTVSIGTLNNSLVHPRETYIEAVTLRAAGIIVAHNHPSGDPTPSREDHDLTKRLREAGKVLGIELLDHIVVGHGRYYSFKERDLL